MAERYDPKEAEPRWQRYWEEEQVYAFDRDSKNPIYSVDTPPPTVSGEMHLGHAFSYSHADFIIRFWRMQGHNIFYPFGFDDNGLATERFVENKLGIRAVEMPRKEFVELCLKETTEIEKELKGSWAALGISPDWSIDYRTIDDWVQKTSQRSFIELYKMGREYRKEAPTIWCPTCRTAIAQVELEDKSLRSHFSDILFELGSGDKITIATTRPELLPSCVSIFVHPEDERYTRLVGKKAKVPLFGQEVPIIADERADPKKGTGIVMCCTFGDLTDIEWWHAHKLPLRISITKDGRMNELAGDYKGLGLKEARKAIIKDLKKEKLLTGQEEISHDVNVHERCGTEIEFLVTKQWFIKYLDLKDDFIAAGRKIKWHPSHMRVRYENWIKGLQWDWCISRQRYYGVPIPVWYCEKCGEVMLPDEKDLPVDPLQDKPASACKCGSTGFEGEKDVLDTWATSSLTPQIAIKWREDEEFFKRMYPMTLRPQAHDIITFWAFNTVVKGLLHEGEIPWNHIMISGHALDPHGRKMSKSKGNVIKPEEVLEKYSADCLRLWAAGSKLGEDLPSLEKDWVTASKFINKMWNACSFAASHLEDFETGEAKINELELERIDMWILSRLHNVIEQATEHFKAYEYSQAKRVVKDFFWHDYCDNYLEIVKHRLYNPDSYGDNSRRAAQTMLYEVTLSLLKLISPITPHVTEELYHAYFIKHEKKKSIHITSWPKVEKGLIDAEAELFGRALISVVSKIRKYKSENGLALNYPLKTVRLYATGGAKGMMEDASVTLKGALSIEKLEIFEGTPEAEEEVVELVPDFSTIGPEFKGEAKKVVEFLRTCDGQKVVEELDAKGSVVTSDGKVILPKHIKGVKRSSAGKEERLEKIDLEELGEVTVVVTKT